MNSIIVLFPVLIACSVSYASATTSFRMCVPHHIIDACNEVASQPNRFVQFECVAGRDRMECLKKVQNRKADVLAADPEDMYIAFNLKNEDFSIFSQLRTMEEFGAEFRYEGIILTRKDNGINSMADLKGKKSCHTGFGRNVGYKIPIARLKKNGVLKVSSDTSLSSVENELKALSEFFTASCIAGKYSVDNEINQNLKQKYPSLCSLCEDPAKCDYPDKFSGYDGSIRCLVDNGGDVAFTKVIYVRRFFGLPIGIKDPAKTEAQANPDDYEYLCEDGTRRAVTGEPCSWAKRPWQGFMSNADANSNLETLQRGLMNWYNTALTNVDKAVARKLWIDEEHLVVPSNEPVFPGDHLVSANYKDVIERDGSTSQKIRLCVKSDIELRKCGILRQAAYSRDIRPEFDCVESRDCIKAVQENYADAVVLHSTDFIRAHEQQLKKIMKEVIDPEKVYAVVADKDINPDVLKKANVKFDKSDTRASDVALSFNKARNIETDINDIPSASSAQIEIVHSRGITDEKYAAKQLICPDFSVRALSKAKTCNFDGRYTRGIFVRRSLDGTELEGVVHGFKTLSDRFGHGAILENVFELFGEFEPGAKNVIFTDDAKMLENDGDVNVLSKT